MDHHLAISFWKKTKKSEYVSEPRTSDGRMLRKVYYYLDHRRFIQVVKLRMALMRDIIGERITAENNAPHYTCPRCGEGYDMLTAMADQDPKSRMFICRFDGSELVNNAVKTGRASEASHK